MKVVADESTIYLLSTIAFAYDVYVVFSLQGHMSSIDYTQSIDGHTIRVYDDHIRWIPCHFYIALQGRWIRRCNLIDDYLSTISS